jgi:hypothetical protein
MPSTRKIAFALGLPLVLAVFILVLAAGIYLFLPHYIESTLLPQLIAETGISDYAINVRRVGFSGADLSDVRIGPQSNPTLHIRSIQIDYSPGELYRQKIDRVVLSGIEVHAQLENGKFTLADIDPQKILSNLQSRQGAQPVPGQTSPPVLVNRVEIHNAAVLLSINHQIYRIPFEIDMTPGNADYSLIAVAARLYPRGQKIDSNSLIDIAGRRIRLSTEISALDLGRFSDIIQLAGGISASGRVNLSATADLQTAPFEISALKADLKLQAWQLETNNIQFQNTDSKPLHATLAGRYDRDGSWQLKVNSTDTRKGSTEPVRFQFNQYEVVSKIPRIEISGRAKESMVTAAYVVTLHDALVDSGAETIRLPKTVLRGTAELSNGDKAVSTEKFELQTPGISLSSAAGKITVKEASLTGEINKTTDSTRKFTGLLRFGGGRLTAVDMDGQINNISGAIPLIWPPGKHQKKGHISIASINYRQLNLGRAQCQIWQTARGFDVSGRLNSDQLSHTSLKFEGHSQIFDTKRPAIRIQFDLARPAAAPAIDLSDFHPDAKGITVKGKFLANGKLLLEGDNLFGSIQSQLINGTVAMPEYQLAIKGVQMSLSMPDLPEVRSAPGQQIRFSKLSLGDLTTENGIIDFQIESLQSLLIEKIHFNWSGGKVDTQALRFSRGIEDYHVVLYCDRLNLARVLEQFGAAAAEGDGTVSGRIPIRYTKGGLSFSDGFLFSTPGAGGKIHLTGTEILTAGIPPNTPQFAQMELAREALKDYDYSWAKLRLNSEGENLLLQMQMDGKPAKTLPFVYKKEIGGFIRVEAESEGSRFQGIRLDVNFRLPLNQLLQYKELIKMIK